jgi:hypothetical protein
MFAILGVDALRIKLRARRIFDLRAVFFENCPVLIGQFRRIKVLKRPARRHDPYQFSWVRPANGHPTPDAQFYRCWGRAGRN